MNDHVKLTMWFEGQRSSPPLLVNKTKHLKERRPNQEAYLICNGGYKRKRLELYQEYYPEQDKTRVTIEGNLRKFYFQKNGFQDLTKAQFVEVFKIISKQTGIKFRHLMMFLFSYCELGVNVRLPKGFADLPRNFLFCSTRKREAQGDYVKFIGSDSNIMVYCKAKEIHQNRPELAEKILSKQCYLRVELQIHNPDKVNATKICRTPQLMFDNWEKLGELLLDRFEQIEFWNIIGAEKVLDSPKSAGDYSKQLIYKQIEAEGVYQFATNLHETGLASQKRVREKYRLIYNSYRDGATGKMQLFKAALKKRIRQLT